MNNIQLIIVAVFFAISAISWIANRLREQAEIKRIRDEMRRREEEALRSTSVIRQAEADAALQQGTKTPTQLRMDELAARRQAQLRELRERQAAEAAGQRRPGTPTVLVPPQRPTLPGQPNQPAPQRTIPGTVPGTLRQPTARTSNQPSRGPATGPATIQRPNTPRPAGQRPTPSPSDRDRDMASLRDAPPLLDRTDRSPRPVSYDFATAEATPAPTAGTEEPSPAARLAPSISADVRAILGTAPARSPADQRRRLRAVFAAAELLAPPLAARDERDLPWNRGLQ